MPTTDYSTYVISLNAHNNPEMTGSIIPILQKRKLTLREVKALAHVTWLINDVIRL